MEKLLIKSNQLVRNQSLDFSRSLLHKIDWTDRLIGILGARGTGKTTLLLQQLRSKNDREQSVYLSLDDIFFTENRFIETAEFFLQKGIHTFYLDEVHKYPNWAQEIKNVYDFHRDARIVFTGSCITDIIRQNADLSRRAIQYELTGLSYREYLELSGIIKMQPVSLINLLQDHASIASDLTALFKPLKHFNDYLRYGYYPFFKENINTYSTRLEQVVQQTIENDLQFMEGFNPQNSRKIYQLFYVLATNVPFKPNITKLSERIGIHRNTLIQYLHYLDKARLINSLASAGKSISILQKPDKIFLENTNFHYALSPQNADKGSLRESFFLNQLYNAGHEVTLPPAGDFLIDNQYTFEVGGKGKSTAQIKDSKNAWVVSDDIEAGTLNKIPLWLFGALY